MQDRYTLLPFLSVVFGLRFDYFNRTDELSIQPRGSLLVELPNNSELQFSYGVYNQAPIPALLSPTIGNPDLKPSRASHYILELKRQISQGTEIKMAAYYKDLEGIATSDEEAAYLNQGVGYAQGTEIFLRHQRGNRFFGWISYAYALSKRRDRAGEPYRPYSFDQTHVATLAASYTLPLHGNSARNGNIERGIHIPPSKRLKSSSIQGTADPSISRFMPKQIRIGYRLTTDWTCASVKSSNLKDGNSVFSWNS